jgi:regulator of ribonuclease activity A
MSKAFPFAPTADLYDQFLTQARVPSVQWKSYGGTDRFAGLAYTIQCFDDNSRLKEVASMKAPPASAANNSNNQPAHILVVDAGGPAARCAVLGDLIAQEAQQNGWAGVVIYGKVRDTAILKTMQDFGIVALGCTPQKSTRRGEGQVQIPIQISNVIVRPGDRVYVDSDGVLLLDPPPPPPPPPPINNNAAIAKL